MEVFGFRLHETTIPMRWDGQRALAVQLVCGLGNLAALVPGPLELVGCRQARAIATGDRRGTVG